MFLVPKAIIKNLCLKCNNLVNPSIKCGYSCIDTWLIWQGTTNTPANYTDQCPSTLIFNHQRSSAITLRINQIRKNCLENKPIVLYLTGIFSSFSKTSTNKNIRDIFNISSPTVHAFTILICYYWYVHMLNNIR